MIRSGICLLISCFLIFPAAAWAEGEDDQLWNRPSYEKKVLNIGQRILAANGITERIPFYVNRRDVRNASASRWGGSNRVVIYKDMLDVIDNDDELAAVLSHEIAHIVKRHHGKVMAKRSAAFLAMTALSVPTVGISYLALPYVTRPMGRPEEREADMVGLDYMVKAGYNPLAMETLFTKFVGDAGPFATFLSSHPVGTDRLEQIHLAIKEKYPQFLTEELANSKLPGSPYKLVEAGDENTSTNAVAKKQPEAPAPVEKQALYDQLKQIAEHGSADMSLAGKEPASTTQPAAARAVEKAKTESAGAVNSGKKTENEKTPFVKPPAKVIYKTAASPTVKPPATVQYAPKTQAAASSPLKPATAAAAQAANPSVVQQMLTLKPDQLRFLQLLSKEQYMETDRIQEEFSHLNPESWSILAQEMEEKQLIRILGNEPDWIYVLTEDAQKALQGN